MLRFFALQILHDLTSFIASTMQADLEISAVLPSHGVIKEQPMTGHGRNKNFKRWNPMKALKLQEIVFSDFDLGF